jgi:N-acetylneuraminate synthase
MPTGVEKGAVVPRFELGGRPIGDDEPPFVIAEVGINHEGSLEKAIRMVDDAAAAGCECVKFQCHVVEDEMIPNDVKPGHVDETIWDIMVRCALSEAEERALKAYVEQQGMIYLSTPFSRAAADRLHGLEVVGYKIGSGECNNYPLIRHVARFGKPIILSTGMNDLGSIRPAVDILRAADVPFAITHCTSLYPTPYDKVRLGAIPVLRQAFPDAVVGLSDHSLGNYACFAAVAVGARVLEKHFTSDRSWPGPDVALSMDPPELADLIRGSRAVFASLGGTKDILPEEQPTIDFAYACVVSTREILAGAALGEDNVWVKRPGTGEIKARDYEQVLGRTARRVIPAHTQIRWADLE